MRHSCYPYEMMWKLTFESIKIFSTHIHGVYVPFVMNRSHEKKYIDSREVVIT